MECIWKKKSRSIESNKTLKTVKTLKFRKHWKKSQNHKQIKDVANIIIYSVADDDYLYTSVRRKVYVWNGEKLGEVCFGEVIFK